MSAYREAFDALLGLVQASQTVFTEVGVGAMPAEDSLVIAPSAGGEESIALDYSSDLNLDVVCNAKHKDQRLVIDALADIHRYLPRIKELPHGDGWQLLSISTSSAPTFIEFDGDQWLYGSGLEVHLSIK